MPNEARARRVQELTENLTRSAHGVLAHASQLTTRAVADSTGSEVREFASRVNNDLKALLQLGANAHAVLCETSWYADLPRDLRDNDLDGQLKKAMATASSIGKRKPDVLDDELKAFEKICQQFVYAGAVSYLTDIHR